MIAATTYDISLHNLKCVNVIGAPPSQSYMRNASKNFEPVICVAEHTTGLVVGFTQLLPPLDKSDYQYKLQ